MTTDTATHAPLGTEPARAAPRGRGGTEPARTAPRGRGGTEPARAAPRGRGGSTSIRPGPGGGPAGPAGRRPAARPGRRADPRLGLVHAFAALWLEVEVGRRPAIQLAWLMDARLVHRLAGRWVTRVGAPGRVRSVSGVATAPGRFDAVAIVDRDGRAGALAVRLICDGGGWKVAEAVCPEQRRADPQPWAAVSCGARGFAAPGRSGACRG